MDGQFVALLSVMDVDLNGGVVLADLRPEVLSEVLALALAVEVARRICGDDHVVCRVGLVLDCDAAHVDAMLLIFGEVLRRVQGVRCVDLIVVEHPRLGGVAHVALHREPSGLHPAGRAPRRREELKALACATRCLHGIPSEADGVREQRGFKKG